MKFIHDIKIKRNVNEDRQRLINQGFIYLALSIVALILAFPIIWMLSVSFKPTIETFSWPPKLLPDSLYLDAYYRVLNNPQNRRFLLNSYLLGIAVTGLSVLIGTLAAFACAIDSIV